MGSRTRDPIRRRVMRQRLRRLKRLNKKKVRSARKRVVSLERPPARGTFKWRSGLALNNINYIR
jgi:hypothetical protein